MEFWPLDKNIIPYSKIKTWDNETHKKLYFDSHDISFDNFGFVVNESELIDKIITKSKKNKGNFSKPGLILLFYDIFWCF